MARPSPENPPPGRLRASAQEAPFHIVLVEPEIPPNTGNVARLCAATCCPLHLVEPLGFRIDEKAVRRAGLDYWHLVQVQTHSSLAAAEAEVGKRSQELGRIRSPRSWLFSGKARRSYLDADIQLGDALVFGKESVGLDEALLAERSDDAVGIPTLGAVRSLNLANSVAIALYSALARAGALAVTT